MPSSNAVKAFGMLMFLVLTFCLFFRMANANASPDLNHIICFESQLGKEPGEIAEEIRNGDARITPGDATQRVWTALQGCDEQQWDSIDQPALNGTVP